ncbi:hypothetical protein L6164_007623 [Bauhinia variegata]|uniref:Uncharacterized protein n=1 Tax=Bauhinia variegata TaxID=167791 RepID=A0ACB9PE09_BAUVA|nr:hypothetical protein L6164_007623 [Bauhinia variegata]
MEERFPLLAEQDEPAGFEGRSSKGSSFHGSVFNLSCSIIGIGIMSLPAAFKLVGIVSGVVLVALAAFLTESSIEMLIRFSKPGSVSSYGDLMGEAFGKFGRISLQASVTINNVGVVIIYMILIEDALAGSTSTGVHYAGILEQWCGEHWWTGRAFVLIIVTLVVFVPAAIFKRMDSLRYMSYIAIALTLFFLIGVTCIRIYKLINGSIRAPKWFPTITDFTSFCNLFTAIPVIVVAYLCHYNVHTIENELHDATKMPAIAQISLALCAALYAMTGLFGYLLFGESTASDLLSNFDSDLDIPYSSLINDTFVEVILLGAIFVPSIWVAFEFLGSTFSALLAFVFPASVTLKDPHGIATRKDKVLSIFMIIISMFSSVIAIYSDAHSLIS